MESEEKETLVNIGEKILMSLAVLLPEIVY